MSTGRLSGHLRGGVDTWEQDFLTHMELQSRPDHDPYAYAHDQAFLKFYESNPGFRKAILGFVPSFVNLPSEAAFKLQKSAQAIEMRTPDNDFPVGRDEPAAWEPAFKNISTDTHILSMYLTNLALPVASNVSERGKLFKAAALLNGKSGPLDILDVGCSLNLNLKRLAMQEEGGLDYRDVTVYARDRRGRAQIDEARTETFNRLIRQPLPLAPSLGIDLFDPETDKPYRTWAKSNSFRMAELLEPTVTARFDRLMAARPENVGFRRVDAASTGENGKVAEQYQLLMISTMLYMLKQEERLAVLDNAGQWADPEEGLVAVLDFVDFLPRGRMRFHPKKDWHWRYKLWVKDTQQPEEGFQHYFTAEEGRASKIILEPGIGRLALARELGLAPDS